jgi:hypothetical protein
MYLRVYLRVYLLGPDGGLPRAILFRAGRSRDDHTTYGFGIFRPHFFKWRHRLWVER